MRKLAIAFLLPLICAAPALGAPIFTAYVAKDPVTEGTGAEHALVDGMDFWSNGSPPRKFQVLGFLTDRRHKSGIYGSIRMSSMQKEIADAARANGGDAVILVGSDVDVVGIATSASAYGTSNSYGGSTSFGAYGGGLSRAITKQDTKYAVIKYIEPIAPPAAPDPAPLTH